VRLPEASAWGVLWRAPLPELLEPTALHDAGARIVLAGESRWALFSDAGALVAQDELSRATGSDAHLDAEHGLLLAADRNGVVIAWRLEDGGEAWRLTPSVLRGYRKDLIARHGRRLLLASHALPRGWRAEVAPADTRLEALDLGDPLEIEEGFLVSQKPLAEVVLEVRGALVAATSTLVVLARRGRLHVFDAATLGARSEIELAPDEEPLGLALDADGRIALLALQEREGVKARLQLFAPSGERLYALDVEGALAGSPALGRDGRAHVLAAGELWAVLPSGAVGWRCPLAPAGLLALEGSTLLAAQGSELVALDAQGAPRVLAALEGETLVAAPVLTERGDLLALSDQALYALRGRA